MAQRETFKRAQHCLLLSPFSPQPPPALLADPSISPPADIEQHYRDILEFTIPLRSVEWSTYAGYNGPWLENAFISTFCCDKPLSDFGGMVPLFVQWTDLWHLTKDSELFVEGEAAQRLFSSMRKDVIYVTVSQHDEGIFHNGKVFKAKDHWNLLVLSGGGFGHARLPLLGKQLALVPSDPARNLFVFAGNLVSYNVRHEMVKILEEESKHSPGFKYQVYSGPDWVKVMQSGVFNLAPRGYGRSSFRTTEIIQMGLIPIYIYDDDDWSAYHGTKADLNNMGYSVRVADFRALVRTLAGAYFQDAESLHLDAKRSRVRQFRESHYTMPGVMMHIEYFFTNDARGDITCQPHPRYSTQFASVDYPIE